MIILKASGTNIFYMNAELDSKRKGREPVTEEQSAEVRAKASVYALVNRHSPPY